MIHMNWFLNAARLSRCHTLGPEQPFTTARPLSRLSCCLFGGLPELVSRRSQSLRNSDPDNETDCGSTTKPVQFILNMEFI